jgi:5'-nucleotidase
MSSAKPKIIVSNDDGIDAEGIASLCRLLDDLAEVVVVAPDGPRSGVGHALSDNDEPIHVERRTPQRIAVNGTPADCARLALSPGSDLVPDWGADRRAREVWLLSGINAGANLGVDTYVSGTAAAAREAAILGFPAIAISQYIGRHRRPDWSRTLLRARGVVIDLLKRRPAGGAFWNVNLPHPSDEAVDCEIVPCRVDPSPHSIRYERRGQHYAYVGDYHVRPRRPGYDVDVCFGGRIAVSEVELDGKLLP